MQAHQASILTIAIVIAVVQMLTFGLSLTLVSLFNDHQRFIFLLVPPNSLYMHMPTTEQREAGLLAEHERLVGESRSGYGSTS